MISVAHLAAIVSYAARNSCKLVLAGDQEQLAAVEGGGAMTLLADRLGYVQVAGDLIICRRNDHRIQAGEPGRSLANGDVLQIEAITPGGIMVRRRLDPDRATGPPRPGLPTRDQAPGPHPSLPATTASAASTPDTRPGGRRTRMRSCGRLSLRSPHRPRSSGTPPSATSNRRRAVNLSHHHRGCR
jgi:AAA domain